eukprot:jgi/Botrbrau1/8889/Bobra.0148s0009.1
MIIPVKNSPYVTEARKIGDIGHGTYGTVEKWQTHSGELVAIKRFNRGRNSHLRKQSAMNEADILKRLRHKNIIRLLQYIKDGEDFCLVLEFVQGPSLHGLIQQQRNFNQLTTDDWYEKVVNFTKQLLTGLQYLHEQNIMHFDIKTTNLLVSEHGTLKICDFGLSCKMGKELFTSRNTITYSAPEILAKKKDDPLRFDAPAHPAAIDVWSVGCVVFTMLTGSGPFSPPTERRKFEDYAFAQQTLECINQCIVPSRMRTRSQGKPSPLKSYNRYTLGPRLEQQLKGKPPACFEFLKACWQMDPQERPSCSDLLGMDFLLKVNSSDQMRVPRDRGKTAAPQASVGWGAQP